jgi:hypothetical protein
MRVLPVDSVVDAARELLAGESLDAQAGNAARAG